MFHYFTRFSYFIPVSIVTNSAAILVSHRVTGSAPFRGLRSNGTTFYLSENPFLFPLKFPDFSYLNGKRSHCIFHIWKTKCPKRFDLLHYCIRCTYFKGTKQWSLSQHQSVIDQGKVYPVLLPFNKTINNWTILVYADLMLFFFLPFSFWFVSICSTRIATNIVRNSVKRPAERCVLGLDVLFSYLQF